MALNPGQEKVSRPGTIWIMMLASTLLSFSKGYGAEVVTVSQDGKGQHRTIQGAINSLSDESNKPRIIQIGKGIYHEKIYIEKNNIVLIGAGMHETIISAAIARDIWRCGHTDDWGVATLNVGASDLTLRSLTVENTYGFDHVAIVTIPCPGDTAQPEKKVTRNGHQMAVRAMNGATRMKAIDCRFRAFGGDTVSPWDVENGMWYFKNCEMEGAVDLYCPRGWAWAENCRFTVHGGTAAIWHDGSKHEDSKSVLVNCSFSGYDGFLLGRYHRDAQIYLVNCIFPANMRDSAIYRVPTSNTIRWGHRMYYYDCHREGDKQFGWYTNNLPAGLQGKEITVNWVFGNRWNPLMDE